MSEERCDGTTKRVLCLRNVFYMYSWYALSSGFNVQMAFAAPEISVRNLHSPTDSRL